MKTFQADGAAALRHKARGRRSNNRIVDGVRDFVLQLIREHYIDFGPTLAGGAFAVRETANTDCLSGLLHPLRLGPFWRVSPIERLSVMKTLAGIVPPVPPLGEPPTPP